MPGFGRESLGPLPCSTHPQHLQDALGTLRNLLLSPSPAKAHRHQPHLPLLSLQTGSLLSTQLPSQEMNILKHSFCSILYKIYKMLSMCQSVLLIFSLFYMLGLSTLVDAGESLCASQCWGHWGRQPWAGQAWEVRWCPPLQPHSFSEPMDNSSLTHL